MAEERRRFIRVKKTFPFSFSVRGENESYDSKTFDISLGGIGFFSSIQLEIGKILYLRMVIPGFEERMVIRGIVRWKKLFEDGRIFLGIEFFNIEKDERDVILKALREG